MTVETNEFLRGVRLEADRQTRPGNSSPRSLVVQGTNELLLLAGSQGQSLFDGQSEAFRATLFFSVIIGGPYIFAGGAAQE